MRDPGRRPGHADEIGDAEAASRGVRPFRARWGSRRSPSSRPRARSWSSAPTATTLRAILPEGVEAVTQARPLGTGDAARSRAERARRLRRRRARHERRPSPHRPCQPGRSGGRRGRGRCGRRGADIQPHRRDRRRLRPHRARGRTASVRADRRGARYDAARSGRSPRSTRASTSSGPDLLWPALERLSTANDQGELYLTDAVGLLVADGHTVVGHLHRRPDRRARDQHPRRSGGRGGAAARPHQPAHMLAGCNDRRPGVDLDRAHGHHRGRRDRSSRSPCCAALPTSARARRSAHTPSPSTRRIGPGANVGPFCYLRPGAELADAAKAGTFVEIKNSQLAAGGEGAAPVLHRRRLDRRGDEHRRGRDHRQLRWTSQAADHDRQGCPHQLRQCLRRARDDRRRRVDSGGIGDHRRRSPRRARRCPCPPEEHRGIWNDESAS